MYVVVVTKDGGRKYDSILKQKIFATIRDAEDTIEKEYIMDAQLNQKYYYKIVEVNIELGERK